MKGKLLVFEGSDGTGKSSITRAVCKSLHDRGCEVKELAFPGNLEGSLGKLVYDIHHNESYVGVKGVDASALQALHIAAHIDSINRLIKPSIDAGHIVVLDRYWWSTMVYGGAAGVSRTTLQLLINAELDVWGTIKPDILMLIDRTKPLREEPLEKWALWRAGYLNIFEERKQHDNAVIIENETEFEDAVSKALSYIDDIISK